MSKLYIYVSDPEVKTLVIEQVKKHRYTDSGFDIPMKQFTTAEGFAHSIMFKLGIHVAAVDSSMHPQPCLLLPRSSIHGTPFRLCNSIGLIDAGYRGEVKSVCDIVKKDAYSQFNEGHRLFQICSHNFLPWEAVILVDSLFDLPSANDDRGTGGFGSTGK